MKKLVSLFLFVFAVLSANYLLAGPVDKDLASQVAKNFCLKSSQMKNLQDVNLSLVYTEKSVVQSEEKTSEMKEFPVFYIFNVNQNNGFVVVSADNNVTPVLGYATKGSYTGKNLPQAFRKLLELYKDEIRYVVVNKLEVNSDIQSKWENLENGNAMNSSKNSKTVSPLLATTWNQSPYENQMCPADAAGPGGHCVTGCPATAMSQIMKFWNYPATGTGFHSYNASNSNGNYGTLTADFGSTTYDWASMPNNLTGNNDAVALLNVHCGIAVEMNYGPNGSGGWVIENDQNGSHPYCSESAYKTFFGYQSSLSGQMRSSHSDAEWKQMMKTDLDAGRPIQYAGWGTGGHTFVCDGYDQNDYFDFNWGWGGSYNGFFDIDALNPGTDNFNSNQQAVFGIQPGSQTGSTSMVLHSAITVQPDPIAFGQSFTVTADILNNGTTAFAGDFCAVLFMGDGTFVDYIQTLTGGNLQPGYYYQGMNFTTSGIAAATPGNYIIALYSRPTGGGWTILGANGFSNTINVTVQGSANDMQLYTNLSVSQNPIVVGQPFSASTQILNNGSTDFTGDISLDLHSSDGTWVQTIQEYTGQTLQAGYYWTDVTFSSTGLSVQPGDYFLVVWDRPTGGDWVLVGSGSYTNPITVSINGVPLSPDSFEPNDSEAAASQMAVNFSGNNATLTTNGSNIHSGTDVDYYKFNLPAGFFYFINARVDDSYNNTNYTADVMFNFKANNNWSDTYDSEMPSAFEMQGGTVVFNVFPFNPGEIGTYLLSISIMRSLNGIADNAVSKDLKVYPNPAQDLVTFLFDLKKPGTISGSINNIFGQKMIEITENAYNAGQTSIKTDVSMLAPGCYFYDFETGSGKVTGKLMITR